MIDRSGVPEGISSREFIFSWASLPCLLFSFTIFGMQINPPPTQPFPPGYSLNAQEEREIKYGKIKVKPSVGQEKINLVLLRIPGRCGNPKGRFEPESLPKNNDKSTNSGLTAQSGESQQSFALCGVSFPFLGWPSPQNTGFGVICGIYPLPIPCLQGWAAAGFSRWFLSSLPDYFHTRGSSPSLI